MSKLERNAGFGEKNMEPHDTLTPMSETLVSKEVLELTLSEALTRGGEFAEVFVEDRATTSAVLDQRRVEELSSGRDRGAGIRVVVGDTTGFAHTADL
jgi:TldD protein